MIKVIREKIVKAGCIRWLKRNMEGIAWWYCPVDPSRSGLPDMLLCISGCFFWFEFKAGKGGRVSKIQKWEHERLKKAGAVGSVIRTVEEFNFFMDEHIRRRPWIRK